MINQGNHPLITTIINLDSHYLNDNNIFLVGGSGVIGADLKVPNTSIMFRHEILVKQDANFIPNGNSLFIKI